MGRVLKRVVIVLALAVILLPVIHQSSRSEDKQPQSKKIMPVKFSKFVETDKTTYLGLKYPNGTPANGTLDFDLSGSTVPASLHKTRLTRIPGDPDTCDAVLALKSDKPGKFRFNATYSYKVGNGNGREFVLTDPEGGSVVDLTIQQVSASLVEGQNGEFAITVPGLADASTIVRCDCVLKSMITGSVFAAANISQADFSVTAPDTLNAAATIPIPAGFGLPAMTDLLFEATLVMTDTQIVNHVPVTIVGQLPALTAEILSPDEFNLQEGQLANVTVRGITPDFAGTSAEFHMMLDYQPIGGGVIALTQTGPSDYEGSFAIFAPPGAAGKQLLVDAFVVCGEQHAFDHVTVNVVPAPIGVIQFSADSYALTECQAQGLLFSITPPPGMTPEQYLDTMQYPFFRVSFPGTQPAYDIWSTVDIHNATIAGGQILCSAVVHVPTGTTTAQTAGAITIYLTSGGQQVSTDAAELTLNPAVPQANVDLYQCPGSTRENSTPSVRFWFYPASEYANIQDIALKFTNSSGELVGTQSVLKESGNPAGNCYEFQPSFWVPEGTLAMLGADARLTVTAVVTLTTYTVESNARSMTIFPASHLVIATDGEMTEGVEEMVTFTVERNLTIDFMDVQMAGGGLWLYDFQLPGEAFVEAVDPQGRPILKYERKFTVPVGTVTQETYLTLVAGLYEVPLTPVYAAPTCEVLLHPAPVVPVPVIQSISPSSGLPLTTVTISGANFNPILLNNSVVLAWQGGTREVAPLSVTPAGTGMAFEVPVDVPRGDLSIRVRRLPLAESNSVVFKVVAPVERLSEVLQATIWGGVRKLAGLRRYPCREFCFGCEVQILM
jgi:hypothetical protein